MKLELHLIPQTSYYINLRNHLGNRWGILSKKIRSERNYTCEICGKQKEPQKMHLHELWSFDDNLCIQKLIGFECICSICHSIHHWGLSQLQGKNMIFLTKYACEINGCTEYEWERYIEKARQEWNRRSEINWQIELGDIEGYFK